MEYYRHKVESLITVKNLITIEYLELCPCYSFPEESHNFWEMIYVDKNSVGYLIDGAPFSVKEGEIIFIAPGRTHCILGPKEKKDASIFVLCFDSPSPVMNFFVGYQSFLDKKTRIYIKNIMYETQNTFYFPFKEKLTLLPNPNLGGQQAIYINLELLLIHLLRQEQNSSARGLEFIKNEKFAETLSDRMIEFLASNVYGTVSIEELCANFNYSKTYLCQVFRQTTGSSIIHYYNRLKIDEAKKLIKETSLSFGQISDLLQFSDPRYFHLLFKKISHMTPKQYKNSILTK